MMSPPPDALFQSFANFQALREATRAAARGKRRKPGAAAFLARMETELLAIEVALQDGSWRPGGYTSFEVHDPKHRLVSAAPFRDRVVHHALCAAIGPIFERRFIHDSYANREGKGTHAAVARFEQYRDRHRYVLRCDIYRYFPAVDHAILKADIARVIGCTRTRALIGHIIDSSNLQEPVLIHYPGDDLFEPHRRRRGLPIGNLTSQLFANVFLDPVDHLLKDRLRVPGYVRYVDDLAVFHNDLGALSEVRAALKDALAARRLSPHPDKTWIAPTSSPARFLGYELLPDGRRRLLPENVQRFRNRLRGLRDRWRAGQIEEADVRARIGAWVAHAQHADTWRLRQGLFAGGWFDPAGTPTRRRSRASPPGRAVAS
jgi:retron-type reverse transcriptase